jgi:DNA-directed RNA polymerase alpha subunit
MEIDKRYIKRIENNLRLRMDKKYMSLRNEIDILRKQVDELIGREPEPDLFVPVWHLELSIRAINCMQNGGIESVGDLVQKRELDLLRIKNLGTMTLREIKAALWLEYGFTLRGNNAK